MLDIYFRKMFINADEMSNLCINYKIPNIALTSKKEMDSIKIAIFLDEVYTGYIKKFYKIETRQLIRSLEYYIIN